MGCKVDKFKGHKIISLNAEDPYPFNFGLPKAKLILENLEAIRAFVNSNGESCTPIPSQSPLPMAPSNEMKQAHTPCAVCSHPNFHYEYNGKLICSHKDCTICCR